MSSSVSSRNCLTTSGERQDLFFLSLMWMVQIAALHSSITKWLSSMIKAGLFLWLSASIALSFPNGPSRDLVMTTKEMSWLKPGVLLQHSTRFRSFFPSFSPIWDTTQITMLFPNLAFSLLSNSRFSFGTLFVAQAEDVFDLSITWCQSRHKQNFSLAGNSMYTPRTPTNPRVEWSVKIPRLSQVRYRAFSGNKYWGANGCPTFADDDVDDPFPKLLSTEPLGGGGTGDDLETETILDPDDDATSLTGSVAGWDLFADGLGVTCEDSEANLRETVGLANVGTAPLDVLAFAITILGEASGGGLLGAFGKFGNSTQEGGWSGSLGVLKSPRVSSASSSSSSSSTHWSSSSPITSHRTVALHLVIQAWSRMKG